MLTNCRETLRHLEKLMEKYEDVDTPTNQDDPSPLRLKETITRNWTKIKWTTKGGDVSDLRDALGAHISAINLALSALNIERGRKIESRTGLILQMAEEMYRSWKNDKPAPATASQQIIRPFGTHARSTVYVRTDMSKEPGMICPRTLIWLDGTRLFECACEEDRQPPAEDLSLTFQDSSLLVRTPKQRPTWEIHLYSENLGRTVQAVVSNLAPSTLGKFEEFIRDLALRQGKNMLCQGMNSPFAFSNRDESSEDGRSGLSVLKMQAQVSGFEDSIEDVTFITGGTRPPLMRNGIQSVRLRHYFSFPQHHTCREGNDKQHAELSSTTSAAHGHAATHFTVQGKSSPERIDLRVNC